MIDLPRGWFSPADIEWYRHIYADLVPEGAWTAEIGCYRGRSLCSVADIIRDKNQFVLCVDTFQPFDADPEGIDTFEDFLHNTAHYGLVNRQHFSMQVGLSLSVAQAVPKEHLDFVFIDADHSYESIKADLEAWECKVKRKGWIGGHDYFQYPGVIQAVNERYGNRVQVRMESLIWLVQL